MTASINKNTSTFISDVKESALSDTISQMNVWVNTVSDFDGISIQLPFDNGYGVITRQSAYVLREFLDGYLSGEIKQ